MEPPDHARIDQEYWQLEFEIKEDPAVLAPLPEPRAKSAEPRPSVEATPFDAVWDLLSSAWFDIEQLFW